MVRFGFMVLLIIFRRLALETEEALKEQDKRLGEILGKHQVREMILWFTEYCFVYYQHLISDSWDCCLKTLLLSLGWRCKKRRNYSSTKWNNKSNWGENQSIVKISVRSPISCFAIRNIKNIYFNAVLYIKQICTLNNNVIFQPE